MTTEAKADTDTLYGVSFRIRSRVHGHRGVKMHLYRREGEPPFEVEDYLPDELDDLDERYLPSRVRECFTRDEADALADYFRDEWPVEDVQVEARIDGLVETRTTGFSTLPAGGGIEHFMFTRDDRIREELPVPVWGYYELRTGRRVETVHGLPDHLEPVDGDSLEPGTRVRATEGEHAGREGIVADPGPFVEVDLDVEREEPDTTDLGPPEDLPY